MSIKIKDLIPDSFLLEGLIVSANPAKVVKIMKTWAKHDSGISNISIDDGIIVVEIKDKLEGSFFNTLLTLMNNLGYYPAGTQHSGVYKKWDKSYFDMVLQYTPNPIINIFFEAKFDTERNITTNLYHTTLQKKVNKILKIGLSPKTMSKISYHPERIYLATSLDSAKLIKSKFGMMLKDETFVILQIDITKLDMGKTKFYNDPNFSNLGVYTYQNIPPQALSII